jgi:hypothetical protein
MAAVVALQLAPHYGGSLGNNTAARGWLGRAASLVEEFGLRQLDGWVLLGRALLATATGQPRTAEPFAREALALARRVADLNLELCALSQRGGALVLMGRVDEGAALLDEAIDTWQSMGLRGTASNDYEVRDIFVPTHRTLWFQEPPQQRGPLYRMPPVAMFATFIAAYSSGLRDMASTLS